MDAMQIANSLPMWIACGMAVLVVLIQAVVFGKSAIAAERRLADYRMAFIDENEGVLLIELSGGRKTDYEELRKNLNRFKEYIEENIEGTELKFGIVKEGKPLSQIREVVGKCRRVIKMGRLLLKDREIYEYEDLGVLAWIDIPEAELGKLLEGLRKISENDKGENLIETLKVYLENELNYSTTAAKLFVHINTVRKRMEKVEDILSIDFKNHISRLKLVILLQYL